MDWWYAQRNPLKKNRMFICCYSVCDTRLSAQMRHNFCSKCFLSKTMNTYYQLFNHLTKFTPFSFVFIYYLLVMLMFSKCAFYLPSLTLSLSLALRYIFSLSRLMIFRDEYQYILFVVARKKKQKKYIKTWKINLMTFQMVMNTNWWYERREREKKMNEEI